MPVEALKTNVPAATDRALETSLVSDKEATAKYGVGPSGNGRKWLLRGTDLALVDDKSGIVYRKRVGDAPAPTPTPTPTPVKAPRPAHANQFLLGKLQFQQGSTGSSDPGLRRQTAPAAAPVKAPVAPTPPTPPTPSTPPKDYRIAFPPRRAGSLPPVSAPAPAPKDYRIAFPPTPAPALKRPTTPISSGAGMSGEAPQKDPVLDFPSPTAPPSIIPEATEAVITPDLPKLPENPPARPQIQLPSEEKPREPTTLEVPLEMAPKKAPEREESSPAVKAMVDSTTEALGYFDPPKSTSIVTIDSLTQQSKPEGQYEITLDPNTNKAWISRSGSEDRIREFSIGTGDTTGTKYGKKYFSPVGVWQVKNKIAYGDVEGSYGPWWLGLNSPKTPSGGGFGLHGPYASDDVSPDGESFINQGFVSHGCMRFTEADMSEVGRYLDVGSTVTVLSYNGSRKVLPNAPAIRNR